ncbi:hypothetical protein TVAG_035790 [Trichomonas vaginalis G3]|uniref:Uncharacterized protein n=1 Tax=Trichomonas vaginalis (strain ATCC PRA-98 / G3) TaxID=412133 RepID=A2DAQ2_TRIV3|nr:armadillo (ARM) repeat-containing protein family [Trichomonas vaginalis G3]EAY22555.1 hypothetical protein TVAG_035790 [Trichomonas vaginalis G3]KAI5497288.1 armadillo (ARM) repeat-containing protein family [Trichomonas vaginalis G3]|eukprot:XP_001583541.1 hypothetical protein [Trichomonas vaginalis G3]
MDDDYKDSQDSAYKSTAKLISHENPINIVSRPTKFSEDEAKVINFQLKMLLSPISSTSIEAAEELLVYTENRNGLKFLIKPEHIKRLVSLLQEDVNITIPLQFLNCMLNTKGIFMNAAMETNIFAILKVIIEGINDPDILQLSFDLLTIIIKYSQDYIAEAINCGVYDNLDMFPSNSSYIPSFASFLLTSLQQKKIPPNFYQKFISPLVNIYVFDDFDVKKCVIECFCILAEKTEDAEQILVDNAVISTFVDSVSLLDEQMSPLSMKLIWKIASFQNSHALSVQNNIFNVIKDIYSNSTQNIPNNFVFYTMKFVLQFLIEDSNDMYILLVSEFITTISVDFFYNLNIEAKISIIGMLRVFIQKCTQQLFVTSIDPELILAILELNDSNDSDLAYETVMITLELINKMTDDERYNPIKEYILSGEFHDYVDDLRDSEKQDLSERAVSLYNIVSQIANEE